MHAVRQAEPDGALPFHGAAKRAIVDERGADRLDAARSLQRIGTHEHAAARRPRRGVLFPVHPGEGVEHLEKEDEGGDQHALGEAFAAQLRP